MAGNNAMEETFGEATILGQLALFTPGRVDRATVPDGYFMYEIRHDDENWASPATIELSVFVNHYGTVITGNEITIPPPPDDYLNLDTGALLFVTSECRSMAAFMEKYPLGAENAEISPEETMRGFPGAYVLQNDKHGEFIERLEKNLEDYHDSLMSFSKQELVEMADKIAAMSDAYSYMCYRGFDDDELDFFLQFQNPLEVAAEGWLDHNMDIDDEMGFAFDNVLRHKQDWLDSYPLMKDSEAPPDIGLCRFMGVDLVNFLGKIAEKTIIHYPNDWKYDIDELRRYSMFEDFDERRLVWHVSSMGTHLKPERNVFIRDSGDYEYMTDYHQNDPDMFGYYVEVTGKDGPRITGNVYEVGNYADFASHIRMTALPLDSVTLTYSDAWGVNSGKILTISRREYDDERHRVMSESGNVIDFVPHPKDAQELYKILRDERVYRMSFPIGSQEVHMQKLTEKLAEIRAVPETSQEQPSAAVVDEPHMDNLTQTAKTPAKRKAKAATEKPSIEGRLKAAQEKANAQTPHKTAGNRKKDQSID